MLCFARMIFPWLETKDSNGTKDEVEIRSTSDATEELIVRTDVYSLLSRKLYNVSNQDDFRFFHENSGECEAWVASMILTKTFLKTCRSMRTL